VPWPFHEFHPSHGYYDPYYGAPQAYFYPSPPPYQEWPPAPMDQSHRVCETDNDYSIDPQDPFARQLRQVENLRTGGYYPVMREGSSGGGDADAWAGAGAKKTFKRGWKDKKGGRGWERKKRDERREREERKDSGVAVGVAVDEGGKEGGEAW
jgi:hypothetical protein